jgi:pimeloyl-ACP methyl ester carboxylesterase
MARLVLKTFRIAGIVLGSIVCLLAISTLANTGMTTAERHRYTSPAGMVEVDGQRMFVHTEGTGSRNVVLLSGWGTPSPLTDFSPLVRALRGDFRVSVVEYFGYGWSDWTNKPRTNENVVEETRLALKEAGILPPYVIVPHSLSGIYALYYANKYPEEISAIIGLDTSVPDVVKYIPAPNASLMRGLAALRITGIVRLALLIDPNLAGDNSSTAFSQEELRVVLRMAAWNYCNPTTIDEVHFEPENLHQVQGNRYPSTIPISLILSRQSVQNMPKLAPGLDWIEAHQNLVAGNPRSQIYLVDGGHYVHWLNSEMIAKIVRETISR